MRFTGKLSIVTRQPEKSPNQSTDAASAPLPTPPKARMEKIRQDMLRNLRKAGRPQD
jgi:hypothetical protein